MRLAQWDKEIKPYLDRIRTRSMFLIGDVRSLRARPDWETLAEAKLQEAERELEAALKRVREARKFFQETEVEAA